jgi:3'-5' exoribonuclease
MDTFDRDDFVKVKGLVQVYQNRAQITVHRLRRLEEHEVDPNDYFPCSARDPEQMFAELLQIIDAIENPHLRSLLQVTFADERITNLYKIAPAAKSVHHACRGGLIEHVLSLCGLCRLVASHYSDVDHDLLLTGAILHDIGKIDELVYRRSFSYSTEGQLLGHIIIGLRLLGNKLDQLQDFPPELRTLVEHMILSHHGELEFGSPKVPVFMEALVLHHLDNLDCKIEAVRNAIKRDPLVDGEFTGWIPSLERVLLKKDRFLKNGTAAPVPDKPALETTAPVREQETQTAAAKDDDHLLIKEARQQQEAAQPEPKPKSESAPQKSDSKPVRPTHFGEKLQAVLESLK